MLVSIGLSVIRHHLTAVDMSFNVISDVGARALAALVAQSSSLTSLRLVNNNIRPAGQWSSQRCELE